jgi:hypothetical protein
MKTFFYSALIIGLSCTVTLYGFAQGKKLQKTYTWKYHVNDDVRITFQNYNSDLVIHTWNQPDIEYKMYVEITLKKEEDVRRLDAHIDDLNFSNSAGSVEINSKFWKNRKNIMGKKTFDIQGEKIFRYEDFKMKGELWVPESCYLVLVSRYSGIELEDLAGNVSLDLYNDRLFGGNVQGKLKLTAKYSNLELKKLNDIEANLYDTDIEATAIGNLVVTSRYSVLNAGDAGSIDINAYNDKYSLGNTGDIKFVDKYSDLTTGISGNVELDCYNSTVVMTGTSDIDLKSKYGKFEIGKAKNLNITSAYDDNYRIESLKTLNITESKYGTYKIGELTSSLVVDDGYTDKFIVSKTDPGYDGMKVDGKYLNIQIAIEDDLQFRFKANVKYPKFDINEEAMNVKIKIKESSQLEMEAIKGVEKEGMPSFIVNGYEVALAFTE